MGNISREELLRLMDESEVNGGIDLDQLYSNAKKKLGNSETLQERPTSHDVVMQRFDKLSFSKVLATAIGGRTTKEFATIAGLEFYAVLKYLELQCDLMPSDETLKAIAAHAEDNITFDMLKAAAKGKLDENTIGMHYAAYGNNAEHSLKNLNKGVTKAQLDDFLDDEENKKFINNHANSMTDAEKDFLRDTEMSPLPDSYTKSAHDKPYVSSGVHHGLATETKSMDVFSKDSKPQEVKDSNSPEVLSLIKKLKALGIREDDYAKTKLGLMSYSEFLTNNPELLNFRRFKTVLKKLVGYNGLYTGLPKGAKFLTVESLFFRVAGNSSVWNVWFHDVDMKQKRPFSDDYKIVEYMDNAIEYIFTFGDSRYSEAITKLGVISKTQKLLIYILSGLLMLGYNEKQILFTLCRPTEPERNWKMKPLRDYCKFTQQESQYTYQCLEVIELLTKYPDLGTDVDNYKLVELARHIKTPSENLLDSSFESLMIKGIDALRKDLRKSRIKSNVRWVLNMQPSEMGYASYRTKEKFDKAFQEYLGYFKELEPDLCNSLEAAYNKGAYFEAVSYVEQLDSVDSANKCEMYEKVSTATAQLPSKKIFKPGESEEMNNRGEIEQICWEFKFGKPY